MTQYELNFNDYWRIIKKKKWLILFTAFMLTFFSMLFTILNKPTPVYEAKSSIRIEKNTSLTGLYMESVSWNYGDDLATRAAIIKSYNMLEQAAKHLGLIDSNLTSDEIKNNKQYFNIIENLKSSVNTQQEGYTNIINILVRSHQPTLARDLANALAITYQKENYIQKNARTKSAINALKKQLDRSESDYRDAEKALQEFRQNNKFMTLETKANLLSQEILQTEEKISDIHADIDQIQRILANQYKNDNNFKFLSLNLFLNTKNNLLSSLQKALEQNIHQLSELQQYYTQEHPKIKNVSGQIEILKSNILTELKQFSKSLQDLKARNTEKLAQLNREYNEIPYLSQQYDNLQRDLETSRNIFEKLKVNYLQSQVKESENIQEVFLLKPAFLPSEPINSIKLTPTTLAGFIIGIVFGIILAFISETLDTTFRTIDDIETTLGTTVQGIIPFIDINEIKSSLVGENEVNVSQEELEHRARLMAHFAPKSTIAESYRSLRTNINFSLMENKHKTIMVTSSVAGEGKTTVATNLALSMAQTGLRTLLIETDLRKPRVSKSLGIERTPGLTDYILNREPLQGCIRDMSDLLMGSLSQNAMKEDAIPGIEYLNILPAGKIERNPSEIIAGKKMDQLIETLKEQYDIIIFDSAPVIQATDAVVLASKVDTNLIVYYQGKISRNTLRRAKNQLELLKSSVLGVVINGMRADISADYIDYKYKYDYLYSYGESHDLLEEVSLWSRFKSIFMRPQSNAHLTFFHRLKLAPMSLTFLVMVLVLIGVIFTKNQHVTRDLDSSPIPENQIPTQSKTQPQKAENNEISATNKNPQTPVPEKIKELQKQYQLETAEKLTTQSSQTKTKLSDDKKKEMISEEITELNLNLPYTIQIDKYSSKVKATNRLQKLREAGLLAYLTPDYSAEKSYIVCIDNFSSRPQAEKAIAQLQFSNITGNYKVLYLPFSVQISPSEFNKNNFYNYQLYENGSHYYFAGSFKNLFTANLFQKSETNYHQNSIVKR
ncbi:MAG: polysaccharide biosynthesis tyrosine autokinase [Candidatus Marinimicrobia bacterium]|nr:polysaccharide biosynthesis tyrosine autokinase [Candidatus Neomarinimicrobiota bacterium]